MRVTDTSRARKFILENKDKYNVKEMIDEVMSITNLSKISINAIIHTTLKSDGYYDKKREEIKKYIRDNIKTTSKLELIKYIINNSMIGRNVAIKLISEVEIEEACQYKINQNEKDTTNRFKGRQRKVFCFDDSNLWKGFF